MAHPEGRGAIGKQLAAVVDPRLDGVVERATSERLISRTDHDEWFKTGPPAMPAAARLRNLARLLREQEEALKRIG